MSKVTSSSSVVAEGVVEGSGGICVVVITSSSRVPIPMIRLRRDCTVQEAQLSSHVNIKSESSI